MSDVLAYPFLIAFAVFFYFALRYVMKAAVIRPPSAENYVKVISERQTILNNAYLYLGLSALSVIVFYVIHS